MKPHLGAFLLLTLLSGCASSITPANIAGYYASAVTPAPASAPVAPTTEPVAVTSECFQLYVHPDGHYVAVRQRLQSGQPVHGSAVRGWTIQERSTGRWTLEGGRLLLTSETERQGTATAQVVRKQQTWYILWDKVEYVQQPLDFPDGRPDSLPPAGFPVDRSPQTSSSASRH